MTVSVAMATYNGEKFIEEQLLSILNQTRQPDEVIISDDGSTDKTVAIIKKFIKSNNLDNWKLYTNTRNADNSPNFIRASLNFMNAVQKSSGDIIFFSDQDDTWNPRKIELMSDLMIKNDKISAVFSNRNDIDDKGRQLNTKYLKEFKNQALIRISIPDLVKWPPLKKSFGIAPGMCMAVRRSVTDYVIEMNLAHRYYHDYCCCVIASALNGLYFYNEELASHRRHDNSITAPLKVVRNNDQRIAICESLIEGLHVTLDVINHFDTDNSLIKEKSYFDNSIIILKKRIKHYQNKSLFKTLLMMRYVPRYIPIKTYLGDIIYLLKLEKYFK